MRKVQRTVVGTGAAVGIIAGMCVFGAATAHAEVLEEITLTVPTPDAENLRPGCTTAVAMSSRLGLDGVTLEKKASVTLESTGCGPVAWTARIFIGDDSPTRSYYGNGTVSGATNPATAATSQRVDYGIGVRELGVTDVVFYGESRLREFCFLQRWEFDAVTWRVKGGVSYPCDGDTLTGVTAALQVHQP